MPKPEETPCPNPLCLEELYFDHEAEVFYCAECGYDERITGVERDFRDPEEQIGLTEEWSAEDFGDPENQ